MLLFVVVAAAAVVVVVAVVEYYIILKDNYCWTARLRRARFLSISYGKTICVAKSYVFLRKNKGRQIRLFVVGLVNRVFS